MDAPDAALVRVVFDGVDLTGVRAAPVVIEAAESVELWLAAGSENRLADTPAAAPATTDDPGATLYSREDLEIHGSGTPRIDGLYSGGTYTPGTLQERFTLSETVTTVGSSGGGGGHP